MKVSEKFPHLKNSSALLVVSGLKSAQLYAVSGGMLELRDTVAVEDPAYTDREGFFIERGNGRVFGSGSVYEPKKQYVEKGFLKQLGERIKSLFSEVNAEDVYLFAPKDLLPVEQEALPKNISSRIRAVFRGNFGKTHPTELLQRIEDNFAETPTLRPDSEEAQKILAETEQAEKFLHRRTM